MSTKLANAAELKMIALNIRDLPDHGYADVYVQAEAGRRLILAIERGAFDGPEWVLFREDSRRWAHLGDDFYVFYQAVDYIRKNASVLPITVKWSRYDTSENNERTGCMLLADLIDAEAKRIETKAEPGEGPSLDPDDTEVAEPGKPSLAPSRQKSFDLYNWALEINPDVGETDRDVYNWIDARPDKPDGFPPTFASFSRCLREARVYYDARKHESRRCRRGRSVRRFDEI